MEEKEVQNKPEKMSYEQLENVAHQLSEQSRRLYIQLQEARQTQTFHRLNYLFKVVEYKESFTESFVLDCINEIQEIMTFHEETTPEEK